MEDKQTCFNCGYAVDFGPNICSEVCMDKCRRGSEFVPINYDQLTSGEIVKRTIKINDMAEPVEDCSDGCRADCQECVDNAVADERPSTAWPNTLGSTVFRGIGKREVADDAKTDDDGVLRSFDTGATRDTGGNKLVFNKFLSAQAIEQYCRYMNMNRLQSDGKLRDGDNWKKGIPMPVYIDSRHRHNHEAWKEEEHRGDDEFPTRQHEVEYIGRLCGILFNTLGYLHEWLKIHDMVMFDEDEPTHEMKERQDGLKDGITDCS
jgi:hypothetical protein